MEIIMVRRRKEKILCLTVLFMLGFVAVKLKLPDDDMTPEDYGEEIHIGLDEWKELRARSDNVDIDRMVVERLVKMRGPLPDEAFQPPSSPPLQHLVWKSDAFEHIEDTEMYVRSATYDARLKGRAVIKMWAILSGEPKPVYCVIATKGDLNEKYRVVTQGSIKVLHTDIQCDVVTAYIECPWTSEDPPSFLSITTTLSAASKSWHKVIRKKPRTAQSRCAICLDTVYNKDDSHLPALEHWFQMQKRLGVQKIIYHGSVNVSESISQVFHEYKQSDYVYFHPWRLPPIELPYCFDEYARKLIYMDCLYRHMYNYRHIVFLGTDEYIVPTTNVSLENLFETLAHKEEYSHAASFAFREGCFAERQLQPDLTVTQNHGGLWPHQTVIRPQFINNFNISGGILDSLIGYEREVTVIPKYARLYRTACKKDLAGP